MTTRTLPFLISGLIALLAAPGARANPKGWSALLRTAAHAADDRPDLAASELEVARTLGDSPVLASAAGLVRLLRGQAGPAMQDFAAALKLGGSYVDGHYWAAVAAISLGQGDEAEAALARALTLGGDRPAYLMLRALTAKRAGRLDVARAALVALSRQRCDLLDPALYPDPLAGLMDAVVEGLKHFPQRDAVLLTVGNLLLRARRYRQAETLYRAALRAQPDSPPVLLGLARIALADGDAPTALRLLDRAVPRAPDVPEIRSVRAEALLVLGRLAQARAEVERAVRQDATSAVDLARLADLLWEAGGYERSEQLYRYALRRENGLASARFGIARCLERRREDEEAEVSFRAAAALNPASERYHLALAMLLERRGKAAESRVSRARTQQAQALTARLRSLERAASLTAGTLRLTCEVADGGAREAAGMMLARLSAPAGARAFVAAHLAHLRGRGEAVDLGPVLASLRPESLWSYAAGPPTVITVSEKVDPEVPVILKRFLPSVHPDLFR